MIRHINAHIVGYAALSLALAASAYADQSGPAGGGAQSSQVGCNVGDVRGFARVHGNNGIPAFYTSETDAIDRVRNCSGGVVQVRRASAACTSCASRATRPRWP